MSTPLIIGLLAGGLFVLIAIAVALQGIEKRRKEKRMLENALNNRARNFQHLLDGFPQGFLSRDLQVLVCKSLADAYEKLCRVDSSNRTYAKQRALNEERLSQFREKAATQQAVHLSDLVQIREVQKLLSHLHKFIAKLMDAKRITGQEAKTYSQQIRALILQTTIDATQIQISEALGQSKPRLAIHHIQSAIEKLTKENVGGRFGAQIAGFQQQLAELESLAAADEQASQGRREEADKEWDELNKPDDSWKKKALYD